MADRDQMGALADPYGDLADYAATLPPDVAPGSVIAPGDTHQPYVNPIARGSMTDILTGLGGGERYQTFPERLVRDFAGYAGGAQAEAARMANPGAYTQSSDVTPEDRMVAQTMPAVATLGAGAPAMAERGALGAFGGRRIQPAAVGEPMGSLADASTYSAFHDAPYPNAPYPQYATQYPPVQAPDLYSKAAGNPLLKEGVNFAPGSAASKQMEAGKAYFGKSLTPEAEAFGKARADIRDQMATEGYQPYFDPALRQHVDPADYPSTAANMVDLAVPAKPVTVEKYNALYDTPEGRARIQSGFEQGLQIPNANNWYAMKQLQDEYVRVLGPEEGKAAFKARFADSMAATTGGSDPTSNLLMSHYANYLQGAPAPPSHQFPYPIGGRYAGQNMKQFEATVADPAFTGFGADNPKRFDFSSSFLGHPDKFTMDEVMTGGLVPGLQMPKPGSYGLAAAVPKGMAEAAGVAPAEYQGIGWAGLKYQNELAAWVAKGKDPADFQFDYAGPMISHVNNAIERTHRLTGMPRRQIVEQGLIGRKIPLYTGIGALGAGAAAQYGQQPQQQP